MRWATSVISASRFAKRRNRRVGCGYNKGMKWFALTLAAAIYCFAAIPEVPKSKTIGNPSAPLRLEVYGDFTCPHCKHLHEDILPQILRDYVTSGKGYVVFRDYTLTGRGHEYSKDAATYAAAAARLNRYQAATDALFRTQ